MAQIFSPRANTILITIVITIVVGLILFFVSAPVIQSSEYITGVNLVPDQPVPFSHQHHAGDLGIDCRYCHQNVESSSFAGMPAASVCMHCHSQIWPKTAMLEPMRQAYETDAPLAWTKVYKLPDYVFFNHAIHINKGMGCSSCHGNVKQMPLMHKANSMQMKWCLDCHRNPEKFVRPKSEIFNADWVPPDDGGALAAKLVREYKIQKRTDCYTCHR